MSTKPRRNALWVYCRATAGATNLNQLPRGCVEARERRRNIYPGSGAGEQRSFGRRDASARLPLSRDPAGKSQPARERGLGAIPADRTQELSNQALHVVSFATSSSSQPQKIAVLTTISLELLERIMQGEIRKESHDAGAP